MSLSSPQIDTAVAKMDAWFETMRGPDGYGGPVVHWWQQSLVYTGAGLDWRYEGIIVGYLQLWKQTGDERWLMKARRAGNDLVAAQLPNGHFPASIFEANPASAGTPHEVACDVGLLLLSLMLREKGASDWALYAACAERNIQTFYVEQLWDADMKAFRDDPETPTFVPNKAATACEALFMLAEATHDEQWVEYYALPTLNRIIAHQVQDGGVLDGAIAQNSFGRRFNEKYIPIYNARCVAALLRGYHWTNKEVYASCALRTMCFLDRWVAPDGSLPTVIYPNLKANRYPCWISPLGDVLHAADACRSYGFDFDFSTTMQWMLAGQDESGGIQTARGFAAQTGGKLSRLPDVRDILHVVGWCDKAFRHLTFHASSNLPVAESNPFETACTFRGEKMYLVEFSTLLEVYSRRGTEYRWWKGQPWADVAAPKFWLR
jgi:hypothetical protein